MLLRKLYSRLLGTAARPAAHAVGTRKKVRDVSYNFRMPAGFAGDVNRTHPANIEPVMNDVTNPVAFYGQATRVNTAANSVRGIVAGDGGLGAISLFGVCARNFPVQQSTAATAFAPATIGGLVAPLPGAIDIIREGYVMVPINGAVTKGGTVFVWAAASVGAHTQGGFEAADPAGNGFTVNNALFNGPADSTGIGELVIRLQP